MQANHTARSCRAEKFTGQRITSIAAAAILALAVGGCEWMRDSYRVDTAFYFKNETKEGDPDLAKPVDLSVHKFNQDDSITAYKMALVNKAARNRLQALLLRLSDRTCAEHKAAISADADTFNLTLGGLTSLFAGAGTIVTGELAQRALSGSAGITNAGRSLLNEQIYRQQISELIVQSIDKRRDELLPTIIAKRAQSETDYTADDVVRDAQTYHEACSFYAGLAEMADSLNDTGLSAESVIARADKLRAEMAKNRALIAELNKDLADTADTNMQQSIRAQVQSLFETNFGLQSQLKALNGMLQISQ